MSEIWTAAEHLTENGNEFILFHVLNEDTGNTRDERRFTSALPLVFGLGGYPPSMGNIMAMQELPWRFRQADNGQIYLDGPGIGLPNYHPIIKATTED